MSSVKQLLLFLFICLLIPFLATAQNLDTIAFDLPLFVINTGGPSIPNEPKIDAQLGIINNPGGINFFADEFTDYDGKIGIEIRGNGSATWPKKSYLFETRKSDGSNKNVSLLGMPKENDWILYAPYVDRTGIRNTITYDLAQDMGHYASRTAHCEVIINGVYQGVYVLAEKIKRDDNRVAVPKFDDDVTEPDAGGYIIRTDSWWTPTVGWQSSILYEVDDEAYWPRYQYVYPKFDDITDDQKQYIQDFMLEVDEAFYNAPVDGFDYLYSNYIDVNSFIDLFLINEFTRNPDGYRLSTYMYLDPTEEQPRLKAGPVWDCNFCYSNYYNRFGIATDWDYDNDWWEVYERIPFWWPRLMSDDQFKNRLICRWEELRKTLITTESLNARIDQLSERIEVAMDRNHATWPENDLTATITWASTNSFAEDVIVLKEWISDRIDWMDQELALIKKTYTETSINLYPNPSIDDRLNLYYFLDSPTDIQFRVYDISGQEVFSGTDIGIKGPNHLNIQNFYAPAGMYVFELMIGEERFTYKFIRL